MLKSAYRQLLTISPAMSMACMMYVGILNLQMKPQSPLPHIKSRISQARSLFVSCDLCKKRCWLSGSADGLEIHQWSGWIFNDQRVILFTRRWEVRGRMSHKSVKLIAMKILVPRTEKVPSLNSSTAPLSGLEPALQSSRLRLLHRAVRDDPKMLGFTLWNYPFYNWIDLWLKRISTFSS